MWNLHFNAEERAIIQLKGKESIKPGRLGIIGVGSALWGRVLSFCLSVKLILSTVKGCLRKLCKCSLEIPCSLISGKPLS